MQLQHQIVVEHNQQKVGSTVDVMIDRPVENQPGAWIGRTQADAPDVDCLVYVTEGGGPLAPGNIVPCEIVTYQDYDLVAVSTGESR